MRARHLVVDGVDDPRGDLGRTERQQAFVAAALAQLGNAATAPLSLDRYARILGDHAVVDDTLDFSHLIALAKQLRNVDPANVSALTFPSSSSTLNGANVLTASAADVDLARQFLLNGTTDQTSGQTPIGPSLTITPC